MLVTQGIGMLLGARFCGVLFNHIVSGQGPVLMHNWQTFWLAPSFTSLGVFAIFFLLFHDRTPAARRKILAPT